MPKVAVRELIGWGLDENPDRPQIYGVNSMIRRAQEEIFASDYHCSCNPILEDETASAGIELKGRLDSIQQSAEFDGLKWRLAIVDLRKLLAFQRRLCFDSVLPKVFTRRVEERDWGQIFDLALPKMLHHCPPRIRRLSETEVEFRSANPNFRIEFSASFERDNGCAWSLSYGSPYMEVACYRGRWFLRDGYHRAYRFLKRGIFAVPAVVIEAETLEVLGAAQPWFFSEETLFSAHPPKLLDFQNKRLVLEYDRPAWEKVIRLTLCESYEKSPEEILQRGER